MGAMIYVVLLAMALSLFGGAAFGQECSGAQPNQVCEDHSTQGAAGAPPLALAKTTGRSPKIHSAIASAVSAIERRITSGRRVRGGEMSSRVVRVDDAGQGQVYLLPDQYPPRPVAPPPAPRPPAATTFP